MLRRLGANDNVGCSGSYRNASDVATGLIYQGTPAAPCDPSANQGWIGFHPLLPSQFRGLTFRFAHFDFGEKFEFDCDTDGFGAVFEGVAGAVVSLRFADGSTVRGDLASALLSGRGVSAQIF